MKDWSLFGEGLSVSVYRALRDVQWVSVQSWNQRRVPDDHEWLAIEDPTCWELALPLDTPYWLGVDAVDREGSERQVRLAADDLTVEVILPAGESVEPGMVLITIIDPPGTKCLQGYSIRVETPDGRLAGQGGHSFPQPFLFGSHPYSTKLRLPPGQDTVHALPLGEGLGRWCCGSVSSQTGPGMASSLVEEIEGEEVAIELRTVDREGPSERRESPDVPWIIGVRRSSPVGWDSDPVDPATGRCRPGYGTTVCRVHREV